MKENKTYQPHIKVYLSDEEINKVKEKAEAEGLKMSVYIRRKILGLGETKKELRQEIKKEIQIKEPYAEVQKVEDRIISILKANNNKVTNTELNKVMLKYTTKPTLSAKLKELIKEGRIKEELINQKKKYYIYVQ